MASIRKTTRKELACEESEGSSVDSGEPATKITKAWDYNITTDDVSIKINEKLLNENFVEKFRTHWIGEQNFTSNSSNTVLHHDPFHLCIIQNFLKENKVIKTLVDEMLDITWSRKIMDLYEFYQSEDLSCIGSAYLANFYQMLKTDVMPLVEKLCNVKLSNVSASCSMYNCGDYLLVHDDLLNDRQIAFVFYLSPWKDAETWTNEMGGSLEIFSSDSNCLPKFPVEKKINPRNNQFIFFKVGSQSFHQVGEVTTFDYPRLTINGWFHGEKNDDVSKNRVSIPNIFISPRTNDSPLSNWIRGVYFHENIKKDIQKVIEDKSEICLENFFLQSIYESVTNDLISNKSYRWTLKGPANSQCYEVLDYTNTDGLSKDFFSVFTGKEMFKLLYEYTDLDLYGHAAKDPMCSMEIQRWSPGSYTILGASSCEHNVLDVIFFLNPTDHVGEITYVALKQIGEDAESDSDSDSILLTVTPKVNALNIIYPSEGASRFTKYISKKTKISNKFVYIVVCSYKE